MYSDGRGAIYGFVVVCNIYGNLWKSTLLRINESIYNHLLNYRFTMKKVVVIDSACCVDALNTIVLNNY